MLTSPPPGFGGRGFGFGGGFGPGFGGRGPGFGPGGFGLGPGGFGGRGFGFGFGPGFGGRDGFGYGWMVISPPGFGRPAPLCPCEGGLPVLGCALGCCWLFCDDAGS